jgi:hypothetical protein
MKSKKEENANRKVFKKYKKHKKEDEDMSSKVG